MDVAPSARKHGIRDHDMLHAFRRHWRRIDTADPRVTIFIGPSTTAQLLEIAVDWDDDGPAIIHAMPARRKFIEA